jgi:hypothetical protein
MDQQAAHPDQDFPGKAPLSSELNVPTEDSMKQQYKFSLGYYLLVFFSIILLESIFFSGAAVKEISYSRFRELLAGDRIQSVIVESDRIFGLEKAPVDAVAGHAAKETPVFRPPHKKAPWNLDFGLFNDKARQQAERQFVVTRLDDPQLICRPSGPRGRLPRQDRIPLALQLPLQLDPAAGIFHSPWVDFWPAAWAKASAFWMSAKTRPASMPWTRPRRSPSTMSPVWTKPSRRLKRWSHFSKARSGIPDWAPNCPRGSF